LSGQETSRPKELLLKIKGWLEARIDGHLVAGNQFVGFVGHANDLLQFFEHLGGHALTEGGSGVGVDTVLAVIGDTDCDVDEFFRESIECSKGHGGLQILPSAFQKYGVVGDGLPEIIDVRTRARGHDVVVNGFDLRASVLVFDETKRGHWIAP
jgi:hypothetical protein